MLLRIKSDARNTAQATSGQAHAHHGVRACAMRAFPHRSKERLSMGCADACLPGYGLAPKDHSVNEPPFGAPTPFSKKQPPPNETPIEVTSFTAALNAGA